MIFSENEGVEIKSAMGFTVQKLILLKKAIRKLKGEGAYEINSPIGGRRNCD